MCGTLTDTDFVADRLVAASVHCNATLYFHDGDHVTIVASKRGWPRHPAWYHNLRAHPDVVYGGLPFRAGEVKEAIEATL